LVTRRTFSKPFGTFITTVLTEKACFDFRHVLKIFDDRFARRRKETIRNAKSRGENFKVKRADQMINPFTY
jgi:hypothetical protein